MRKIRAWLPAIFWMILIFFLSSRPSVKVSESPVLDFLFFKGLHLFEYGALFFLIYRASKASFNFPVSKTIFLAFTLTLIYAISDEIHQLFVPTREGRIQDIFIDSLGAFVVAQLLARDGWNDKF